MEKSSQRASPQAKAAVIEAVPRLHAFPGRSAWSRVKFAGLLTAGALFYAVCLHLSQIDPVRLWTGLPRLATWLARGWPLDFSEIDVLLVRAAETVAMATVGTTLGLLIAAPLCLLAARNTAPASWLYYPARWLLNALRGIDSFIFALIFVAAVGLGPFAGVLGLGFHVTGTLAKLWSEAIEAVERGPLDAAAVTGAGRLKVILYALLPDVLPNLTSITLYLWEVNVRASTVLGIVGAGGIGQELKNSVDLLAFDRVFTIITIILVMVTAIDQFSAWLRQRII